MAWLAGQGLAGVGAIGGVEIAPGEGGVVALAADADDDAGAALAGGGLAVDQADAAQAAPVFLCQVAAGDDLQPARPGNIDIGVENVAAGGDPGNVVGSLVEDQALEVDDVAASLDPSRTGGAILIAIDGSHQAACLQANDVHARVVAGDAGVGLRRPSCRRVEPESEQGAGRRDGVGLPDGRPADIPFDEIGGPLRRRHDGGGRARHFCRHAASVERTGGEQFHPAVGARREGPRRAGRILPGSVVDAAGRCDRTEAGRIEKTLAHQPAVEHQWKCVGAVDMLSRDRRQRSAGGMKVDARAIGPQAEPALRAAADFRAAADEARTARGRLRPASPTPPSTRSLFVDRRAVASPAQ